MMSRRLPWLVLLLALGACKGPQPEDAFRVFTQALGRGEHARAWDLFSADTRRQLDALVQAQWPTGAASQPTLALLLERGLVRASREIVGIEVLTQSGGCAVLKVADEEGETQQVTMVLEDGAWKVHLELPANPT